MAFVVACAGRDDGAIGTSRSGLAPPKVDAGASLPADPPSDDPPPGFQPAAAQGFGFVIGAGDASPWMVGKKGRFLYHYDNGAVPRAWVQDPGTAGTFSVAVSPEGTPWIVSASGSVLERKGAGAWQKQGALAAYEVGVGRNTDAWAISRSCNLNGDCDVYRWTGDCPIFVHCGTWNKVPGIVAQHLAVAPDGAVYTTTSTGDVFRNVTGGFDLWEGAPCARSNDTGGSFGVPVIGAASNESVWVLTCSPAGPNTHVESYLKRLGQWQTVAGDASTIAVAADGTPWIIEDIPESSVYHGKNGRELLTNVDEFISPWTWVGPTVGFTLQDVPQQITWTSELQDVAAGAGYVYVGATSGGVWRIEPGPNPAYDPIGDVGAGVTPLGNAPSGGPGVSIGSIAVKPSDPYTLVVSTGIAVGANTSSAVFFTTRGNGIWYTHSATAKPVAWKEALCGYFDCPPMVKIRYSADSKTVYAISSYALWLGTEDGNGNLSFLQASGCGAAVGPFTDLVADPRAPGTLYIGVSNEGVYQSTDGGNSCTPSNPIPPASGGTITDVALAISNTLPPIVYAMIAGTPPAFGNDFRGIFGTTTPTYPAWSLVQSPGPYQGLRSQGGHDWTLATDPNTGSILLAGGTNLSRGTGCGLISGCATFAGLGAGDQGHQDDHSILWTPDNMVYVVNDGGVFQSFDDGATITSGINHVGVAQEVSVAVGANGSVFATAWDVGPNYSAHGGPWVGFTNYSGGSADGHQMLVDPADTSNFFMCTAGGGRSWFDGASWSIVDANLPASGFCNFAMGLSGGALTVSGNGVFQSPGTAPPWTPWSQYDSLLPGAVQSIVASNEPTPSVYAVLNNQPLPWVSVNGGSWQSVATPPGWPAGYGVSGGSGAQGASPLAVDSVTSDVYFVGGGNAGPVVYRSSVSSHGSSWVALTGTDSIRIYPNENVDSIAVDPAARDVIVTTEAVIAGVYRLNNPDVTEGPFGTHHWRPWVDGLPNDRQRVEWSTGQYEDGVYYYYIATWGRGVWKRDARGGDW